MKETTRNYIGIAILAGFIGTFGGIFLGTYYTTPTKAYVKYLTEVKDLSSDRKDNVIIKSRDNSTWIFMEQEDGSYVLLNQYIESKKKATLSKSQLEIKALEQEEKDIKATARFVQ